MARVFQRRSYTVDKTESIKMSIDGVQGKFAVYARRINGTSTATLGVYGSFVSGTSDTNARVQITAPVTMGTGPLTQITALSDEVFPFVIVVFDITGSDSTFDVYVSQL